MATKKSSAAPKDSDLLKDAFAQFEQSEAAEAQNRTAALEDIRFARLGEQWDSAMADQRRREGRPILTINRMPSFGRQVVNDARQNKPTAKTIPAAGGTRATANVFDGLIRQIQNQSSAHIAYDTGLESAVYGGFGYWRVDVDYAYNDSFDLDILILPVENPFSVYGDCVAGGADSRDWNYAFVIEDMPRTKFEQQYPDADPVDFNATSGVTANWSNEDTVRVAEWWNRTQVKKPIVKLSDGRILDAEIYLREKARYDAMGLQVTGERETLSHKVVQRVITATEILSTTEWKGCYIPIIPVYGDVVNIEGERHYRGLFRDAKDPQRMFNFWRTAATEIVALAPRVPYIGARGQFNTDNERWATVNRQSHAYIEYDPVPGMPPPMRQPLDGGVAAGALQEAMNAADDMKAVTGIFDASLGAKSNETSGRAIMARQRKGDTSTFHFIDNRDRAIEHTARVLVDLIPHIYTGERVVTILSEDLKEAQVTLGKDTQPVDGVINVFDLTVGKYSLVMKKGLSYTTKREEAAVQQIEFAKVTGTGQLYADVIAKNLDWPGAEVIEERLKRSLPPHILGQGPTPAEQQMQMAIQQLQQALQQAQTEITGLKLEKQADVADSQVKMAEVGVKDKEVAVKDKEMLIKDKELDVRAMELANEAQQLQVQMAQANMDTSGINQAVQALMQQVQGLQQAIPAVMETANKPRKRKGRAVKRADGTWDLEAVDEPQQPIQ